MTTLTPDLREGLRAAIDRRRRALVDEAGGYAQVEAAERHAARGPVSKRLAYRRAAESGVPEQEPALVERARSAKGNGRRTPSHASRPLDETPAARDVVLGRCVYCGAPSRTVVCRAHEDLL